MSNHLAFACVVEFQKIVVEPTQAKPGAGSKRLNLKWDFPLDTISHL